MARPGKHEPRLFARCAVTRRSRTWASARRKRLTRASVRIWSSAAAPASTLAYVALGAPRSSCAACLAYHVDSRVGADLDAAGVRRSRGWLHHQRPQQHSKSEEDGRRRCRRGQRVLYDWYDAVRVIVHGSHCCTGGYDGSAVSNATAVLQSGLWDVEARRPLPCLPDRPTDARPCSALSFGRGCAGMHRKHGAYPVPERQFCSGKGRCGAVWSWASTRGHNRSWASQPVAPQMRRPTPEVAFFCGWAVPSAPLVTTRKQCSCAACHSCLTLPTELNQITVRTKLTVDGSATASGGDGVARCRGPAPCIQATDTDMVIRNAAVVSMRCEGWRLLRYRSFRSATGLPCCKPCEEVSYSKEYDSLWRV